MVDISILLHDSYTLPDVVLQAAKFKLRLAENGWLFGKMQLIKRYVLNIGFPKIRNA